MFTGAVELDVLDDHHVVVVLVENRAVEQGLDVLPVAAREELQGFGDAVGRPQQALPVGVFADEG